jgi:hypothetical protein
MKTGVALSLLMVLAGVTASAQEAETEVDVPKDYISVPVSLNGVDYVAEIDIAGGEPVKLNGVDLDLADYVPGAVRVSRADGQSMADEGYRAREVIAAACSAEGATADPAVVPILSPAGRWIFHKGCV